MRILILSLIFAFSCTGKKNPNRVPANELDRLKSRIENSINPYELLDIGPGATEIEIERETSKILEQISGWNLFELTKYTNREEVLDDLVTLKERDQSSVKKVIDSYSLLLSMRKQKGFKLKFLKWKWNLGKPDQTDIKIDSFRDIKIFYEDPYGQYEVKWGELDFGPFGNNKQTGYIVSFKSMAADPANQELVDQLKIDIKAAGKKGLKGIPEMERLRRQLQEYINVPDDQMYTFNKSQELIKELDIRYKIDDVLPTYVLQRIMKMKAGKMKCRELIQNIATGI